MAEYIVPLDRGEPTLDTVGGKALNLSKMLRFGFGVPPAVAVTVEAYDHFFKRTGLYDRIAKVIEDIDFDNGDSLIEGSSKIKNMILSETLIPEIKDMMDLVLDDLGGEYYAVRSSAVAEDLPEASFAGQQDTFLNVSRDDVLDKMVMCWASYWNDRAMKYRNDASVDHLDTGMAVVIQRMVDSDISGVMFTANPLDGSTNIVIEASWGLGESIASGIVTPDRFVMDRECNVLEESIKTKSKGYFLVGGENVLVDIPQDKANVRCVGNDILKKLISQGLALESHFGVPQDIEWAVKDGNVYVLQSRNVTTITSDEEKDDVLWTRAYGDEYWADATTPLFFSVMGEKLTDYVNHEGAKVMGYNDIVEGQLIKLHKTRAYFNSWVLERVFSYYPKFIRSKELLNYFPLKDQERISKYPNDLYHTVMSQLFIMVRDPDGMLNRTDKAYKKWAARFMEICKDFDATDLSSLSDDDLMELYNKIDEASLKHYRLIRYGMVSHSILSNLLLKNWLAKWADDKDGKIYAGLISGLPDNKTVGTNVGFSELAKIIRNDPEVHSRAFSMSPEEFIEWMDGSENSLKPEFNRFIAEYGHRSNTREIMSPRWREDRPYVLSVAKMLSENDIDLKAMEISRKQDRVILEKETLKRLKHMPGGHIKAFILKKVMNIAQTYLIFRENQRFYLDHILFRQRIMLREMGKRMEDRGQIQTCDDVFFLYKEEAFNTFKDDTNQEKLVSERKKEFYRYCNILPPKFLKNGIDFDDTVVTDGESIIYGAASSPGTFTGVVRVVEDIRDLSCVKEGEILVTSNTDPGWTAVFSKLGGLITETGGILSHGAVISREYRIPAVTAVKNATVLLKTGQKVIVDGNDGAVHILEDVKNE